MKILTYLNLKNINEIIPISLVNEVIKRTDLKHEDNFFKGRKWQRRIAEMRLEEATTIEDVYKLDSELYDWWMRTDYKDNQR